MSDIRRAAILRCLAITANGNDVLQIKSAAGKTSDYRRPRLSEVRIGVRQSGANFENGALEY